ncbi:C-5 cytosine-specific DNA methylase [compost metagenome]
MAAYYNEIEPYAAQWLRNLIAAGHIAPGDVDERSIEDVHPDDLRPYTQCHFFAGIGAWSIALRRAGWPDTRPVWTGSCPCQPFSQAGEGAGFDDPRHLWPSFDWLIRERRPPVVFGEQVASKDAEPWLDLVQADVEAMGYAFGAVPFPSSSVGAPHIRDRLYWVADVDSHPGRQGRSNAGRRPGGSNAESRSRPGSGIVLSIVANANGEREGPGRNAARAGDTGWQGSAGGRADMHGNRCHQTGQSLTQTGGNGLERDCAPGRLAYSECRNTPEPAGQWPGSRTAPGAGTPGQPEGCSALPDPRPAGPVNGLWGTTDWLFCRDGKWRPVEPGTFPLVNGAASRVGRLRAYGNAINVEAATQFIAAYMEATG